MDAKTVLILEDEELIRRLISRLVMKIGCGLQVAGTVQEAVSLIDTVPLDLLITDIKLPDGEGYDAIRRLNERLPGAKTVIVTGLIPSEVHLQELALKDIADVVQKPFTLKEMEQRLRKILRMDESVETQKGAA